MRKQPQKRPHFWAIMYDVGLCCVISANKIYYYVFFLVCIFLSL